MKKPSIASDRAWQRMLSGRRLDLLDPSPLDIEVADIAHGLARVARWNGQTSGAHIFSVAQHTLLVECVMREQVPRLDTRFRLAALLHDAPEYVIGDLISPFKAAMGANYKAFEARIERAQEAKRLVDQELERERSQHSSQLMELGKAAQAERERHDKVLPEMQRELAEALSAIKRARIIEEE